MSNLPPFDPPFQIISAEFGQAMLEFEKSAKVSLESGKSNSSTINARAPGPVVGTRESVYLLVVPFAEKEGAKELGARWDAAVRKWYVPIGKDRELFKRWWPTE